MTHPMSPRNGRATGLNWIHDADFLHRLQEFWNYEFQNEQLHHHWWKTNRRKTRLYHTLHVLDDLQSRLHDHGALTIPPIGLGDHP